LFGLRVNRDFSRVAYPDQPGIQLSRKVGKIPVVANIKPKRIPEFVIDAVCPSEDPGLTFPELPLLLKAPDQESGQGISG
jgi:hypothetical protein